MRNKLLILVIVISFVLNSSFVYQQIPENIKNAFKAGNSNELAKYFNTNVELVILDNEAIYSKAQAELVVKDFFRKNKPLDFKIVQEDKSSTPKFLIGRLVTSDKCNYRVYISVKNLNDQIFINQIKIENEE